jgi:hypothetical protein
MAHQEGGHWFSLETVFLLLHVVILVMMLRPHSLRLEVATVHQQFHLLRALPCGFTPVDDFVIRHVLNRDGTNTLS